eukprot:3287793-Rhodomonas_salina.3
MIESAHEQERVNDRMMIMSEKSEFLYVMVRREKFLFSRKVFELSFLTWECTSSERNAVSPLRQQTLRPD